MSVWPNRIILLLSWLGIFIAGVLSYSKAVGQLVPCSTGSSCQTVSLSTYSTLFNIPVAYLGLATYATILALATARFLSPSLWRKTAVAGMVISAVGSLFSAFLTYVSVTELKTTCEWCLGSGLTMILLLLTHGWLMSTSAPAEKRTRIDWGIFAVGGVAALIGVFMLSGMMASMSSSVGVTVELGQLSENDVMGPAYKRKGDADAPVTLVEWGDLNCPPCRLSKPKIDEYYAKYKGRLRYCFRNFPLNGLPGHESSMIAARITEICAQKGKYWEFIDTAYDPANTNRIKDADGVGLRQVATSIGIDAKYLEDELAKSDENSPNVKALADDMTLATKSLNLSSTPSFIVLARGFPPKYVKYDQLERIFLAEPYKSLLASTK